MASAIANTFRQHFHFYCDRSTDRVDPIEHPGPGIGAASFPRCPPSAASERGIMSFPSHASQFDVIHTLPSDALNR